MKKYINFPQKPDKILFVCSILASLLGIFIINSASYSLDSHIRHVLVQSVAFLLGGCAMVLLTAFDYGYFKKLSWLVFGVGIGLLILGLAIGKLTHGTQGWIALGPITLQPAEIAKLCFIITFSVHIEKVHSTINNPKTLLLLFLHFLIYVIPVLLQPDFGTAMVFTMIFAFELFFAGIYKKYIFGVAGAVAVASPIIWFLLKDYQRARIITLFFPESDPTGSGYQVLQSKLAIGSGMLWGRGYLNGPQTQYGYLPEKQTDFIYSVIGEELGIIGALIAAVLLFIIIQRCFFSAKSCSHDTFGEHICIGVGAMLFSHVIENIGMCLGLMPITGIPLPFMSYGGSSLVTCFAAVGLVQSVRVRIPKKRPRQTARPE